MPEEEERQEKKRETTLLSDSKAPLLRPDVKPRRVGALTTPWRLLMQIGNEAQTTVGMEVSDQIIIGRADPPAGFFPDLDLTPYGGLDGGVSRRHVRIMQGEDRQLYIEDMGSTNGTRLNGFELKRGEKYKLNDGDEIELGRVRMVVRFMRSPV